MRIISGKFKGSQIKFLKNLSTRPLKDSVKENIFNILLHSNNFKIKISQANVLDLYSGIGSFGLECISRGAKNVTFIERDINAVKILKQNLSRLSILNNVLVIKNEVQSTLSNLNKKKYNIFFFDPPFEDLEFYNNLQFIKLNELYDTNHIVIIHRENKASENFEKYFHVILEKKYGRSKIVFGNFN